MVVQGGECGGGCGVRRRVRRFTCARIQRRRRRRRRRGQGREVEKREPAKKLNEKDHDQHQFNSIQSATHLSTYTHMLSSPLDHSRTRGYPPGRARTFNTCTKPLALLCVSPLISSKRVRRGENALRARTLRALARSPPISRSGLSQQFKPSPRPAQDQPKPDRGTGGRARAVGPERTDQTRRNGF